MKYMENDKVHLLGNGFCVIFNIMNQFLEELCQVTLNLFKRIKRNDIIVILCNFFSEKQNFNTTLKSKPLKKYVNQKAAQCMYYV